MMKTTLAILIPWLLIGCQAGQTPKQEEIAGFVAEQRANTKSVNSWNAPSDPYYVLERKEGTVTVRPSPSIPTEKLATLKGRRVLIKGYHTEGEPYRPTEEEEPYPMKQANDFGTNGVQTTPTMRPANRGVGFIVTRIIEMK